MFVGDSITTGFGSATPGGYRADLITRIASRSGQMPTVVGWDSAGSFGDNRICAETGLRTDEILTKVLLQAPAFKPNVIFLHVGTNDTTQLANIGGPNTVVQSMANVNSIINAFRNAEPQCHVFVAQIVDNQTWPAPVNTYNSTLTGTIMLRSDYPSRVHLVNARTGVGDWNATNFSDATHPSSTGYGLLSLTWFTDYIRYF